MLTDRKRKRLLAGVLAAVMLTGTAGCGTDDKNSETQGDTAAQEEKKDEGSSGGFFHGFFPWYFIGRTFGVGPMAGVRQSTPTPNAAQKQNEQQPSAGSAGAANKSSTGEGKGSTVQQGSSSATQKSTLGSTGSTGKTGIGSGLSRSSGSAIS